MLPFVVYYALLVLWLPLLWPAFRLKGAARAWLLTVAAAGLSACLYETWMWFGRPAEIRLDILLIGPALLVLYVSAVAILFWQHRRKTAALFGLALLLIGGTAATLWNSAMQEGARLTEVFHARDALLFEAKFRGNDGYRSYFGLDGAEAGDFPVGHWLARGETHFTRLIVNPAGRAWLFYRCGETECHHGPGEEALKDAAAPSWKAWQGALTPRIGNPVPLRIIQEGSERLSVEVKGRSLDFVAAPPPLKAAADHEALVYLGAYAALVCQDRHTRLRQVWLWQEEGQLYAIAIAASVAAGGRADFLSPHVLGESTRDGDRWSFKWRYNGQDWRASIALEDPKAAFTLQLGTRKAEALDLERGAIVPDEVVELAPLTTKADWDHWFETVLTGHFTAGKVPAC